MSMCCLEERATNAGHLITAYLGVESNAAVNPNMVPMWGLIFAELWESEIKGTAAHDVTVSFYISINDICLLISKRTVHRWLKGMFILSLT